MLRILCLAASLAAAGGALAQTTQPGQTTPSITPSDTPSVTPSQTPSITPSQTPGVTPPGNAPIVGGPAPVVSGIESRPIIGLSQCENVLAADREKCLQDERAAAGNTAPAGTR
jgi:hypothetical protein